MRIYLYVFILPTADKTLGGWMYWVWDDLPTQQTWRLQFQGMCEYGIMLASFPGLPCFVVVVVVRLAFSFHRSGKAERKRKNKNGWGLGTRLVICDAGWCHLSSGCYSPSPGVSIWQSCVKILRRWFCCTLCVHHFVQRAVLLNYH